MKNFTFKRQLLFVMFMLLGCLSIQAADDGLITKQMTIELNKAGTLPDRISESKKYLITNLKIVGYVNGTDWRFIREMAGCDCKGKKTDGKLSILDLSDARIVKGGLPYLYFDHGSFEEEMNTSYDKLGYLAFEGCSSLTSLTIPSSVTSISSGAFLFCGLTNLYYIIDDEIETYLSKGHPYIDVECGFEYYLNDKKITSVVIPSTITELGEYAFQNCRDLTSVYVSWPVPLSASSAFSGADISKSTLYVPQGTEQDYWLSPVWGDFGKIVEFDATGIDKVTTSNDAKELSRYSVNGQRLSAPSKGLNIVKYSDGSVKKIAVQ